MPRHKRCIVPGVPYPITQRGVNRQATFSNDDDRTTYLGLLRDNLTDAGVRLLAWCLMTNHVHLIARPERVDSLAVLFRRLHGRYAQYYNARAGRSGHLWQNRFHGCALGPTHLWTALVYVEQNPVRAGMVASAGEYRWSSARAHLDGRDETGLLDMDWWRRSGPPNWATYLAVDDAEARETLRRCTYAGRPYGSEEFVNEIGKRFGRYWTKGRPSPEKAPSGNRIEKVDQYSLF